MTEKDVKDLNIGISIEELQEFYDYVAGKANKPSFVDRFMTDLNGRLKEMVIIVTELQLAQIPALIEYNNNIKEIIFSKSNLETNDLAELVTSMCNINKDIRSIIETSTKAIQTINSFEPLNSEYRNLLNGILLLPEDKLRELQEKLKD